MFKVYDNVLDRQMLNYVDSYVRTLPYFPHTSTTIDEGNFFATENLDGHQLFNFLTSVITEYNDKPLFKECPHVTRVYVNAHNYGKYNGGRWHTDEGDNGNGWCNVTILFYPQQWQSKDLGGTLFKDGDKIETVEYVRNRMIVFPANIPHKAQYHLNKKTMRYSIAYKMRGKLNDW